MFLEQTVLRKRYRLFGVEQLEGLNSGIRILDQGLTFIEVADCLIVDPQSDEPGLLFDKFLRFIQHLLKGSILLLTSLYLKEMNLKLIKLYVRFNLDALLGQFSLNNSIFDRRHGIPHIVLEHLNLPSYRGAH